MMQKINNIHVLKTISFILCSFLFVMITASKCNKTNNVISYTVKFNTNGGSVIDSIRVVSGSKVSKPTDPTRNNYIFEGWYMDNATFNQPFDFNTPIIKDITLYAKWMYSIKLSFATTVVGMREFLLTTTATDTSTISFIVTESATAPTWDAVNTNQAKIVRKYTADNLSRKIYFSVTDQYKANGKFVNLVGQADAVAYTKAQAPGIMIPGQTYYVHAYYNGKWISSSKGITLADYPSTYPTPISGTDYKNKRWIADPFNAGSTSSFSWGSYLWGMDMWIGKRQIEIGKGEVNFFPVRTVDPLFNYNSQDFDCLERPSIMRVQLISSDGVHIILLQWQLKTNTPAVNSGYLFATTDLSINSNYDVIGAINSKLPIGFYTISINNGCPTSGNTIWDVTVVEE